MSGCVEADRVLPFSVQGDISLDSLDDAYVSRLQ